MDTDIARLALFLDPTFREMAVQFDFRKLCTQVG